MSQFKIPKSHLMILVLLILSAVISWNLYFKNFLAKDTVNINDLPRTIESWVSNDLPITDEEYAILETRNAFVREYTSPKGEVVYLFIVYSQHNRKVSHPPEICYTGGGVSILESVHDEVTVDSQNLVIDVNRLLAEGRGEKQIVFYWFKVGTAFTPNYWKQQILIAVKTLFGSPSSSALIRLSAPVIDNDKAKASESLKDFTKIVTPHLFKYLP